MWIMVSGPYRTGADSEEDLASNVAALNRAAYEVVRKGHVPIIGVNLTVPIIQASGEERCEDLMMPLCLELAKRCDAVLRVGGASTGADQEVEAIRARGGAFYRTIEEIPAGEELSEIA